MNLLDIFEQREPYQQAIDALEQRRIEQLREKIDYLKLSLAKANDDEMRRAIKGRIKEYEQEIIGYHSIKETQPTQQPPAKGLLKGKDLVTPQQRVAGATTAKPGVAGAVKDVAGGIKRWLKGEPDQGPTYEAQETGINPRALGVANFQRLVKANMGNVPTVNFEFIRPEENFKLDQKGLDLISDYYDGLENDQAKNYFIYRVLPSGDETLKVLKQLGWTPQQVQQQLPGIPTQGELPLSEKKKSKTDDLQAGDVKVARELQKLRAQYPAARSDIEAVARAEIDSTERSQRQLAAIRGANEKQDALLKQLVALDQEQGREINSLDSELDRVQSVNDKLQQTIQSMTGTKKASTAKNGDSSRAINLIPGAPADTKADVAPEPVTKPAPTTVAKPTASPAIANMARQITGFQSQAPSIDIDKKAADNADDTDELPIEKPASLRKLRPTQAANKNQFQQPLKVAGSDITTEHGGGIGPKQHWQDLMQEGQPQELINRYLAIDAENDVDAVRAAIQAISRDPELGANSKSRLLGQIGMIIRRHRLPIGRSYYTYMQRYMEEQTNPKLDALIKNIQARVKKDDYQRPEIMKRVAQMVQQADPTIQDAMATAQQLVQQHGSGPTPAQTHIAGMKIVPTKLKPGETMQGINAYNQALGQAPIYKVEETVTNVRAGMAEIYRRLAPKIERYRDSFLAGQLYDELENYAELHGAEGEFKRMMATARGRAHMEYDTNPGGFHNWFWFLPFEDNMEEGIKSQLAGAALAGALALGAGSANARVTGDEDPGVNRLTGKPNVTQAVQGDQVKPSAPTGFSKEYLQSVVDGTHPRPMITKEKAQALLNQLKEQGVAEGTDDVKKRMSKLEALALAANRDGDDAKCKMYQQKIQSLKQKLSQSMAESSKPGEYYVHTVYFKDGTKKRIRVTSDEFDVVGYYTKRGQAVDRVDYDFQIHSDMTEDLVEGIKDTAGATAVIACLLTGGSLTGCATAPQQTSAQQVLKTGQDIGRTVQTAKKITRAGTEAEVQQELRNILRGINRPEELNHSNILRIWRRVNQPNPQQNEAREIVSKEDFLRERDRLLRMIGQETNPANKQILKSAIRQLENRAENEGWITIQNRMMREDSDNGEAVEMAIMRRILVAHTDLIIKFGLDKVVQAIEEVAYDVGDVDEIGSSDVSGWVRQVKQILGVDA